MWNSLVIGGLQQGKDGQLQPFLGTIGMIGTHYEDAHIATGEHFLWREIYRLGGHLTVIAGGSCATTQDGNMETLEINDPDPACWGGGGVNMADGQAQKVSKWFHVRIG